MRFRGFKRMIERVIISLPAIRDLYWRRFVYRSRLDEGSLRSMLQQLGHRMDLSLMKTGRIPLPTLREFEFLMREFRLRGLHADEWLGWAIKFYGLGKLGIPFHICSGLNTSEANGPDEASSSELAKCMVERRSIRKWTEQDIDTKDILEIIEVAKWCPSSCNRQPWQVKLIRKEEEKRFLSGYFSNTFWINAPLLMLFLMDTRVYNRHERHFAYLDGAALIQNTLLMLHSRGFGACWLGFKCWDSLGNVHVDEQRYSEFYRFFSLDRSVLPISMIALGRPSMKPQAPPRPAARRIVVGADETGS